MGHIPCCWGKSHIEVLVIFRQPVPLADHMRVAMYQFYQIFLCLLKFDFFCFVGVTMQVCTRTILMCVSLDDR